LHVFTLAKKAKIRVRGRENWEELLTKRKVKNISSKNKNPFVHNEIPVRIFDLRKQDFSD